MNYGKQTRIFDRILVLYLVELNVNRNENTSRNLFTPDFLSYFKEINLYNENGAMFSNRENILFLLKIIFQKFAWSISSKKRKSFSSQWNDFEMFHISSGNCFRLKFLELVPYVLVLLRREIFLDKIESNCHEDFPFRIILLSSLLRRNISVHFLVCYSTEVRRLWIERERESFSRFWWT